MLSWVGQERRLSSNGPVNFLGRNFPLLDEAVGHDHEVASMKKVEHPVIEALQANPKLLDAVPKQVCFRAPQFVAQFPQSLQSEIAFILCLRRQLAEPVQKRARTVVLTVEHDSRSWH